MTNGIVPTVLITPAVSLGDEAKPVTGMFILADARSWCANSLSREFAIA